ncbi:MAG: Smr/MutS family protein [Devosiaceae bacterium]|nr:Smr/MutS family protein [Devosiaceae bacterium MH13]
MGRKSKGAKGTGRSAPPAPHTEPAGRPQAASEDKGLWDRVKRTVDPLDADQRARYSEALSQVLEGGADAFAPGKPVSKAPAKGTKRTLNGGETHLSAPKPAQTAGPKKGSGRPPLVALDRKGKSRIVRGRTPIDARVDLHGLRQHEAHEVLRGFIFNAHARGHRTVLVITGKGTRVRDPHPDAPPWAVGSGVLRRAVPGWLAAPELRGAVLSVEPAHASHGGEGALYVRLRAKPKGNRP